MRIVIQRVTSASVKISGEIKSEIGNGLMVLLGIEEADTDEDILWLCGKIARLRVFSDQAGVMNLSVMETGGEVLLISQFTLHASTQKGNRPGYMKAAKPEIAIPVYKKFIFQLEKETGKQVHTGEFGADMKVSLVNDGPVTIFIDSKNKE
ncbi:MAG: D-aminoacyl-tRNA deacylase [Bacteroidota bacterium]